MQRLTKDLRCAERARNLYMPFISTENSKEFSLVRWDGAVLVVEATKLDNYPIIADAVSSFLLLALAVEQIQQGEEDLLHELCSTSQYPKYSNRSMTSALQMCIG